MATVMRVYLREKFVNCPVNITTKNRIIDMKTPRQNISLFGPKLFMGTFEIAFPMPMNIREDIPSNNPS
jgi:hypothetical protein